jgi:hypothetical protein
MNAVLTRAMFLVIRTDGKFWDGYGWNQQGREFLSLASATRSLYEEGEDLANAQILPLDEVV